MKSQVNVLLPQRQQLILEGHITGLNILEQAKEKLGCDDFYILQQGRKLEESSIVSSGTIHVVPRLPGGKGGFGSMLRAIGAQIEKTTNREACRDLSGRRLRDINEEKRLKTWINQQADRERDAAERKRKRLERLVAEPKLEFKDPDYEAARSEMTDKVSDAVEQGFKAAAGGSGSQLGSKRAAPSSSSASAPPKKKKACLWMDMEEEGLSSSVETDSDTEDNITTASRPSELKTLTAKPCKDEEKIADKASASPEKEAAAATSAV